MDDNPYNLQRDTIQAPASSPWLPAFSPAQWRIGIVGLVIFAWGAVPMAAAFVIKHVVADDSADPASAKLIAAWEWWAFSPRFVGLATCGAGVMAAALLWHRPGWRSVPIIFTVIAALCAYDAHERRKLTPSADLTLVTFFDWQPGEHYSANVNAGSKQRLIVYGDEKGVLPSGPSAYVFDRAGDLIDWTCDEGDDVRFQELWRFRGGPIPPIDRRSARQWLQSNAAPPG